MKKCLFAFACTLLFMGLKAQKANIANFRVDVERVEFPTNFIPPNERTYSVSGPGTDEFILYGWTEVEDSPNLIIVTKNTGFNQGDPKLNTRKEEKKNKEGKVTSTTTYYSYSINNAGSGIVVVRGVKNEKLSKRQKAKLEKQQAKEKEEQKEDTNPFLAGVETEEKEDAKVAYRKFYNPKYAFTSQERASKKEAWDLMRDARTIQTNKHKSQFRKDLGNYAHKFVNNQYGYQPMEEFVRFKILKSKKHPEYEMYQNAMEAVKTILTKMKYNDSVEELKGEIAPIADYMEKLTTKYTDGKKHSNRIRSSAFINLSQLYYCLDEFDKSAEYAQQLIDLDLDKKIGERLLEKIAESLEEIDFHQMDSRHMDAHDRAE